MDNLRSAVQVLFFDRQIVDVVQSFLRKGEAPDLNLGEEEFTQLFVYGSRRYSIDSIRQIKYVTLNDWMCDELSKNRTVFNILARVGVNMLVEDGNELKCQYWQYLRWNELTVMFGENLFTTSFLAYTDVIRHRYRASFSWKPVIVTDNIVVSRIMSRGLSECHFHLEGSSLNFDVNWMALTNNRFPSGMFAGLIPLEKQASFPMMVLWAAAIRYYIHSRIMRGEGHYPPMFDLDTLLKILSADTESEAYLYSDRVYRCIRVCREMYGMVWDNETLDYAIPQAVTRGDLRRVSNIPLIGERFFMYNCLKRIYSNDESFREEHLPTLFYIYLLAKHKIMSVFIQQKNVKGFANFDMFERRKDRFCIKESVYERLIPYLAVNTTLDNQNIDRIELRVAPKQTVTAQEMSLKRRTGHILTRALADGDAGRLQEMKDVQVGFVMHFIKRAEPGISSRFWSQYSGDYRCRNYKLRINVMREAKVIAALIERGSPLIVGNRNYGHGAEPCFQIVGIDAANSEFNARPEVFAPAYRLIGMASDRSNGDYQKESGHRGLRRTCHVAEDYYDLVDGLRAIDEAVLFLELGMGDRIGHAVALGSDVASYYRDRHDRVVMPKQVLLDNIAWLMNMMDRHSLPNEDGLRAKMSNLYVQYCNEIYGACSLGKGFIPLTSYIRSWYLRSNTPVRTIESMAEMSPFHMYNNSRRNEVAIALKDEMAKRLFVAYHYNRSVKQAGSKAVDFKVDASSYALIERVQRILMQTIVRKGIAIETNPTSNLRITDVKRYDEHPILRFNAYGLEPESPDRPRIMVSINTDDQGVFATSLEKEYTLMALALEKTGRYSRESVYDWLEHVREMGEESSFLD